MAKNPVRHRFKTSSFLVIFRLKVSVTKALQKPWISVEITLKTTLFSFFCCHTYKTTPSFSRFCREKQPLAIDKFRFPR